MAIEQHFIVEGKYLGQAERKLEVVHGVCQTPYSFAYFCPTCGEVWARCPVMQDEVQQKYRVVTAHCRKHQKFSPFPAGALSQPFEQDFTTAMPFAVVQRELLLHIDWLEQQLERN